jgi:hypothetical protein
MTEQMKQVNSINDILNIINKTNEQFAFDVWVPSLNKDVPFREITTGQQKTIVKTIVDSPTMNSNFITVTNNIIKNNCADPEIAVDNLTIIDKLFILMKMRAVCIDKNLEIEKGKSIIDLDGVIESAKKNINIPNPMSISNDVYKIYIGIPTIKNEKLIEEDLHDRTKDTLASLTSTTNSMAQLGALISDTYTSEIVKYVEMVEILNNNEPICINFNDVKISDRIKIIETIPVMLVNKIIEFIQRVKVETDKILTVKIINGTEVKEEVVSIDTGFFTKS